MLQLPTFLPHIRFVHSLQPGHAILMAVSEHLETFTNHLYQFHMTSHTTFCYCTK